MNSRGDTGWCQPCMQAYRSGEGRMSQEQRRAVREAAAEKQRATLAAKRAERAFWKDARSAPKPRPAPKPRRVPEPTPEPFGSEGSLRRGGALNLPPPVRAGAHVVGTIRFGRVGDDTRWTTCAACDFTCTGDTDEQMARAWQKHVWSQRPSRSGPVERVAPAHRADDDEDEQDSDAA